MKPPRFRFTIRRFMLLTAVLAASMAYLISADQESRATRCGTPPAFAVTTLFVLAMGSVIVRLAVRFVVWSIRHPS